MIEEAPELQAATATVEKAESSKTQDRDLKLNNTLRIADSFAALDRLLLNNGLVGTTTNRDKVNELTEDIKDTWLLI